jgi:hypothetical protein
MAKIASTMLPKPRESEIVPLVETKTLLILFALKQV